MDQGKSEKGGFSRVIGKIAGRKQPQGPPLQAAAKVETPAIEYLGRKFSEAERKFLNDNGWRVCRLSGKSIPDMEKKGAKIVDRGERLKDYIFDKFPSVSSEVAVPVVPVEYLLKSIIPSVIESNSRLHGGHANEWEVLRRSLDVLKNQLEEQMWKKGVSITTNLQMEIGHAANYVELAHAYPDVLRGRDLDRSPLLTDETAYRTVGYPGSNERRERSHFLVRVDREGKINPYVLRDDITLRGQLYDTNPSENTVTVLPLLKPS